MGFIVVGAAAALIGYCLGLSMAGRIAEYKIKEMRLEAGLDIDGEEKEWEKWDD